jgi:integrase
MYQRKLLQIYLHWLALTGMRTGEALKLRHGHVVPGTTELYSDPILRIIVPKDTKTGPRTVSSQPQLIVWYETLIELTGTNAKGDWLFCDAQGKRNEGFFKTIPKLFEEAGVLLDADGGRRSAYSLRHYYAEQRLIELGTNARAFDIIGENIGTGRQYLEDHYVRKGIMQDEDALVTAGGKVQYNRAVATEIAEAYIEVDTHSGLDD